MIFLEMLMFSTGCALELTGSSNSTRKLLKREWSTIMFPYSELLKWDIEPYFFQVTL